MELTIWWLIYRPETDDDDDENDDVIKVKPPRPPRKKVKEVLKEPLYEEDIIEGFSFVGFKTYEDLEVLQNFSFVFDPFYNLLSN